MEQLRFQRRHPPPSVHCGHPPQLPLTGVLGGGGGRRLDRSRPARLPSPPLPFPPSSKPGSHPTSSLAAADRRGPDLVLGLPDLADPWADLLSSDFATSALTACPMHAASLAAPCLSARAGLDPCTIGLSPFATLALSFF